MSSGKKQNQGYYYFLGLHFGLCHGPIDFVDQIWFDKKLAAEFSPVWTSGEKIIFNLDMFGGPTKEGGIGGGFELDMGGSAQTPNPYLLSKITGQIIPAFRGIVSIIAKQIYVGTTTYLKNPGFRASRIHVRQNGIAQWYDAKAEVGARNAGGGLVSMVAISTAASYTDDVNSWPNPVMPIAGGISPFLEGVTLDDRYLIWNRVGAPTEPLYKTLDGINWTPAASGFGSTGGGGRGDVFKGAVVIGRGIDGYSYSLDKGETFSLIPNPPRISNVVGGVNIAVGISGYATTFFVMSDPTTGFATGAVQGINTSHVGSPPGCYDSLNDQFYFGGDDGAGTYHPLIVLTLNGMSSANETLPATTNNTYIFDIKCNLLGRVVAVTSDGKVLFKPNGGVWAFSAFTFTYSTYLNLSFFDGTFVLATGTTTIYHSVDGDTWTTVNGLPLATVKVHGGLTFDTRVRGRGDMNPAHIIRECLTDPYWGLGYQDADINDVSFMAAADTLYAEGMGMSLEWNTQTKIEEFITLIVRHIDAAVYLDRRTGKFCLKLIRDDYDIGDLVTLDESNIAKVDNFTQPAVGELTNSVTVQFWNGDLNKDDSVTVQDIALIQLEGEINTTVNYSGFTTLELASRVAERDMRVLSTPIISCTIYANRDASELNIGDTFIFSWSDWNIDQVIMRVTGAAYGDGRSNQVRLTCTQDVYRLPVTSMRAPEAPYVPPSADPVPIVDSMLYEVPYFEAVQQLGQTTVDNAIAANDDLAFVGAAAARPSNYALNADMQVDSGGGYSSGATLDFSPTALLNGAIDKDDTALIIDNVSEIENAPDGSFLQVGNEIMVKVSYAVPTLTVKRGALDTVPANHADNTLIYFWDVFGTNDTVEYVDGETLDVKLLTHTFNGTLALTDTSAASLTFVGRLNKPYAPGQFKINGSYYPAAAGAVAIVPTWVHRDRLLQTGGTILGTLDAGVGPEPGTTYTVRYYDDATNTLLNTESGISGTTAAGYTPIASGAIRVELEAVRGGIVSYQFHSHVLNYTISFDRITEAGDTRITESGDTRVTES